MDHSWRPWQAPVDVCPVCRNCHFPFCPPPPAQYNQPPRPPPPPDQFFPGHNPLQIPNDSFLYHAMAPVVVNPYPSPPPRAHFVARPWVSTNGIANHGFDGDAGVQGSAKRMRIEEKFVDDERRLRLIRDHGSPAHVLNRSYDMGHSNVQQNFGGRMNVLQNLVKENSPAFRGGDGFKNPMNPAYGHLSYLDPKRKYTSGNQALRINNMQNHMVEPLSVPYGLPYQSAHMNVQPAFFSSSASQKTFSGSIGATSTSYTSTQNVNSSVFLATGENEQLPMQHFSVDKSIVIDASHIFKHPYRANRPDRIVVILRGLPGSGKSYMAKILRDIEVENGGAAPRIHSMDEYFMAEVEKVDEVEISMSSGAVRSKKPLKKKVMEYLYEPEMEEAYRSSMLKAFKKTLDEGAFPFVIVDDRNLRIADFAQFWATAKRSGYEVYLLEAAYNDPVGCTVRNVHGFSQDDIIKMGRQWEDAPSMYLRLDAKSLLHDDNLEKNGIQEFDMDTEDLDSIDETSVLEETNADRSTITSSVVIDSTGDDVKGESEVTDDDAEALKELEKSKWSSSDLDDEDGRRKEAERSNGSAVPIEPLRPKGKSVRWADQIGSMGFSISGGGPTGYASLVIGSGSGYNSKSNPPPMPDEEDGRRRRRNVFQFREQVRAEHQSLRALFRNRRTQL